jgi:hypothetical protein
MDKIKRCPNGTRRDNTGNCVAKSTPKTRKRCPNGTRRNKAGDCVGSGQKANAISNQRVRTTPPSKENIVILTAAKLKTKHNIKISTAAVEKVFKILTSKPTNQLHTDIGNRELARDKFTYLANRLLELSIKVAQDSGKKIVSAAHVEQGNTILTSET